MRKISFLVLVGVLAFSLESCSFMSKFGEKSVETVFEGGKKDIKQANKNQKSVKKEPSASKAEEFERTKREENVAGLIPATKPDIRVRSSIRGRQDPFAVVAIQPRIEIDEEEATKLESPIKASENITSTPTIETGEVIPTANLAENVFITGFIELGDRIKLIVQAPEETSARYVEIGQYISNGQVLVKRIEPGFPTPTVILEQDGVEVTKVIGEAEEEGTLEETKAFSPFDRESITSPLSWLSN